MHLQLDSRPGITDVSADGLALRFAASPGLVVVGTASGTLPQLGLAVAVEVLAASHRVHLLDAGGTVAIEQVACVDPAPRQPLPGQAVHDAGGHRLAFRSERADLDGADLAARAASLRATADDDASLVVAFPGHDDALTSVQILADGWETWHLYPGARPHAVRTRTTVVAR